MKLGYPVVHPRDLPRGGDWSKRRAHEIVGVTLHHTASDLAFLPTALYHSTSAAGLKYTFWVDYDGTVVQATSLQDLVTHSSGAAPFPFAMPNTHFVGVALRGDLSMAAPPPAQQVAVRWLWAELVKTLSLGPDMLFGHGEFRATECPGEGGRALVRSIIESGRQVRHLAPTTIREVQVDLESLGYETGPLDGLWGPRTRAAVELATDEDATRGMTPRAAWRIAKLKSGG